MMRYFNKYRNQLTLAAFLLIIVGFIFGAEVKTAAFLLATVIAGVPIAIKAFQAVRMRVFSIELLVTIAVIGALFIGEYTEAAIVTFLFMFGDYLEGRTLEKTRASIRELIDMAPQEAVVLRDDVQVTIPVEEVVVGDRVIIHSGGMVPVDGSIISGKASMNEAAVTGESVPAQKALEDAVFSGTIVDNGYIEMVAEKVGDDTTFSKIIELVEEAQESKSKTEKFLNKFANIYTPGIVLLAIIVYFIMRDLHIAITFLVVACPGALVIGAPVSNVAGIGNGARNGVLIKGGEVLDQFSKVDTVVFDKTGTLTKGRPEVTDIAIFNDMEEATFLTHVAILEKASEHHLGKTIVKAAENRQLSLKEEVMEVEVIKGNGLTGIVNGKSVIAGNRKLMNLKNITISDEIAAYAVEREKAGNTAIIVAIENRAAGIISIADQIRDDAKAAIAELRNNGIKQIIMLTGDNKHTAALVSNELGLDAYHAELLPEDKVAYVKELRESGHIVAMAGDGINDAPAIATAHIGLAMGEGGTDVSMETADVVLMADKLKQFSHAFVLSKATIRNMWQNTIFAVAVVAILLYGVLNGTVHLASGMFIHEASVLIVILNGMRLIRFKQRNKGNEIKQVAESIL